MSTLADLWIRYKYLTSLVCISVWEQDNWSLPCKEQSWLIDRDIQSQDSGGNIPPSGKGRGQSIKMEPGGPFVPGKPGKPLIPLNPGSPAGPGFPVNEEYQKISVYNNGRHGQFLQSVLNWAHSGLQEAVLLSVTSGFCPISTEKHSHVLNHFHRCAFTWTTQYLIYCFNWELTANPLKLSVFEKIIRILSS